MAIDLFVNIDASSLDQARANSHRSLRSIGFKELVAGDTEVFDVYLVGNNTRYSNAYYNIQDYSVRMGLGTLNGKPTGGTWSLGAQTALAHDIDAAGLQTAFTAEVAACTVTKFADFVYKVTFDSVGAQTIPSVDATNLSPDSTVNIAEMVAGDGSTKAEWLIRFYANPIAYNSTWTPIDQDLWNSSSVMKGYRGTLNLGTSGVYDLMGNASSVVTTIEIEITDGSGYIQTVLQMPIKITGEVLGQGATGTVEFDSYLTAADIGASVQQHSAILDATTASYTTADETKLAGIEDAATADQTGAEIKTAYELEADTNAFTDADKAKLDAIEAGATADQTGAEIKTAYELEADTNAFTDADKAKLDAIEASASADQTGAEIKAAYEGEADTNAFTDAYKAQLDATTATFTTADETKLDGIATGAEVNTIDSDTTGEPTGSDQVLNVVSLTQAEYNAGTPVATTLYVIV